MSLPTVETKTRPILFKGPMVRAILDGSKTQTRRLNGLDEVNKSTSFDLDRWICKGFFDNGGNDSFNGHVYGWNFKHPCSDGQLIKCPYGVPGDGLWVRETFWGKHDIECGDYGVELYNAPCLDVGEEYHPGVQPCATPESQSPPNSRPHIPSEKTEPGDWWMAPPDGWDGESDYYDSGTWTFLPWGEGNYTKHPSIHMPRWASRITLEVTDVRVERVQEISANDAKAEGLKLIEPSAWVGTGGDFYTDPRLAFRDLWDSINAKRGLGWSANPWVWVVTFRRLKP